MYYRKCFQHLYDIERKRIPGNHPCDLRLHRLERPLAWSFLDDYRIQQYPDYPPFIAQVAEFAHVEPNQLVLGAGIEDLIRSLVMLSCDPGDAMAITWPTCAMFEIYARVFDAKLTKIVTNPKEYLTSAEICRSLPEGLKLFIMPNPGQPVEVCLSIPELRRIAARCRDLGAIFAIDEAYYGFGAPTALPLIDEFDNVLILRTFSKAFGAASARVGYAMGQRAALYPLEAARQSGEVAGPSMRAISRLLAKPDEVNKSIAEIVAGRDWLRTKLNESGFHAVGKYANHVLIDMDSQELALLIMQCLKGKHIYVKGDFPPPLDHYILVTAGPQHLMEEFFNAFMRLCVP